jgi:hypothetical protein
VTEKEIMEMEPLLAALPRLRNDLTIIYADFERIEAHLKGGASGYGQRLSDLKAHVDDMDRHLEEVLAHAGITGKGLLPADPDRSRLVSACLHSGNLFS